MFFVKGLSLLKGFFMLKDIINKNIENNILEFTIDNHGYEDIINALYPLDRDVVLTRTEIILKEPSNWGIGFTLNRSSKTVIRIKN